MCELGSSVCFLECYINSEILQILYARVTLNVFETDRTHTHERKKSALPVCTLCIYHITSVAEFTFIEISE